MIPLPPLETLTARFRRMYDKRREENMHTHYLVPAEAALEAHQFVARQMWLEAQKKSRLAAQIPLFDLGKKTRKASKKERAK